MKKNSKRNLVAAAGAATILSLVFASPSMAASHSVKKASSSSSTSTTATGTTTATGQKADRQAKLGVFAKLSATVTGVPTTVTTAEAAHLGAYWTVYALDATATAVPATQPTTGGVRVDIHDGTLATGTLTGTIPLKGGAASTVTNYAIYPSTGGAAIFATVSVDAAGVATVTSTATATATYDAATAAAAPAKGAMGEGKQGKGGKGKGPKGPKSELGAAGISATVNVPADGKTYTVRVTETAEKGVAVANPVARPGIAVTGTGAVSIKLPLGASDTYKIELVAADGTVASTVTVTVAADGTVATPITLG